MRKLLFLHFWFVIVMMLMLSGISDALAASPQKDDEALQKYKESTRAQDIEGFRKRRDEFFKDHPRSPLKKEKRREFHGLDYYPIDLKYFFSGKIRRYRFHISNPKYYAEFLTNKGMYKRYVRYGIFDFELEGERYEIEVYKSILSDNLFVPFKDRTSGKETYELGRYLDAEILPGYYTIIDFNKAYYPSCAYNTKYVCVIPPEKNFLDIEIRAGERGQP